MRKFIAVFATITATFLGADNDARAAEPMNKVAGTWQMVSAQIDPLGANTPAYGPRPNGWLVFTEELTFVEVLTDSTIPKFQSDIRGRGTDAENRAAMAGSIGFFGRYTVDDAGEFNGNVLEGSTFPNWVGHRRTREQLSMTVVGDTMTEEFRRPDGTEIKIVWERLR